MSRELSAILSPAAATESRAQQMLRGAGIAMAASAFVAVCAHISLPLFFTPVPLTLQPFAVLVVGLLLSPRLAFASLAVYLVEGAAGLPVFTPAAGAMAGIAHLIGPTGGYLLAYPVAAPLISSLFRRTGKSFTAALAASAAGNLVILACGALWYSILTHAPIPLVLAQTVVPFLPGDALKVAAAAGVGAGFARLRRSRS